MDTNEWILNNKKVCLCRGITRKTIVDAIRSGATTLDEVAIKTRAGTGACHGTRCDDTIKALIAEFGESQG